MTSSIITAIDILKDIYKKHFNAMPEGLLKQLSSECWAKFLSIGLPQTSWEDWQYADLSPMFDNFFNAPTLILKKANPFSKFDSTYKNTVKINDGRLQHASVSADVKVCAIAELNNLEINLLVQKIRRNLTKETNPFALFNYSLLSNGVFIKIAGNANLQFQITSECDSSVFVSPFLMIECGANSKVEIIYQEIRDHKAVAGMNSMLLLEAGVNSNVNLNQLQMDGGNGFHLSQARYELNRFANISVQGIFAGSELARLDTKANLEAEGAEFNFSVLNVLKGICQQHHFVRINHLLPNGTSSQLYKNLLLDKSKVSVDGTVDVSRGAKQTNSQQLINNLFLSDGARAFTKPNLRILNDDVKCKHGATSGSLEKENLFYLKSRGLSDDSARKLIMKSFANEVLSKIENPDLLEYVSSSILGNI